RIGFEFRDEPVVAYRLPDAQPRKERHQEKHRDDRDVVRRRRDGPKLVPVVNVDRPKHDDQQSDYQDGPFVDEFFHTGYFFLATALISDSSITGAGPEIPPSFLMRQKCTAMNIDATRGIPMQCQM